MANKETTLVTSNPLPAGTAGITGKTVHESYCELVTAITRLLTPLVLAFDAVVDRIINSPVISLFLREIEEDGYSFELSTVVTGNNRQATRIIHRMPLEKWREIIKRAATSTGADLLVIEQMFSQDGMAVAARELQGIQLVNTHQATIDDLNREIGLAIEYVDYSVEFSYTVRSTSRRLLPVEVC